MLHGEEGCSSHGNSVCKGTEVGTWTAQPLDHKLFDVAGEEIVYTGEGDES